MANLQQTAAAIVASALQLPQDKRTTFINQACGGDGEIERAVVDLLFAGDANASSSAPTRALPSIHGRVLAAGDRLGRFLIQQPFGSGGMGSVYRALDEKLQRTVALKTLNLAMFTNADARRRFRTEALALAKLSHPNIATIYDVGEQDGIDFIVMECIAGQTLTKRLESGPLSLAEAVPLFEELARALEEAHEQGIIHRDLKPANLMITPRGQLKVLDFGIAKLLAPLAPDAPAMRETGFLIGTPYYMSPEQVRGRSVDARTDLWSFGVILYEALAGRTPFAAGETLALLQSIVRDTPVPLHSLRSDVPAPMQRLVERCLEKDPKRRLQTASEARAALAELAREQSSDAVAARGEERRRASTFGFAALAILLAALALGAWLVRRSA